MTRPVTGDTGDRRGFTLVELAVVLLIIALLAGLAVPNMTRTIDRAKAAEAYGDMDVVKNAVLQYQADNNAWPGDENRGQVPDGLEEYLPGGFSFAKDDYVLDYDNWSAKGEGFIGVTVITSEDEMGLALLDMLGPNSWTNGSNKYTVVFEWTS